MYRVWCWHNRKAFKAVSELALVEWPPGDHYRLFSSSWMFCSLNIISRRMKVENEGPESTLHVQSQPHRCYFRLSFSIIPCRDWESGPLFLSPPEEERVLTTREQKSQGRMCMGSETSWSHKSRPRGRWWEGLPGATKQASNWASLTKPLLMNGP